MKAVTALEKIWRASEGVKKALKVIAPYGAAAQKETKREPLIK